MHLLFVLLMLGHWLVAGDLHVEPRPILPRPLHLGHDSDWALLDSTVAQMRKVDPNAPVVIVTGDFLAHHFPNDVPLAKRTMARIVRTFNAAFPRAQFLIAAGNNDDPCGDYRLTPGTPYFSYIAHLWAPLVNRSGAAPNFERDFAANGWYSARLPVKGSQTIVLDSVYWSWLYRSCSNADLNPSQREFRWLAQLLATTPRDTHVIVIMHIPPGDDSNSTLGVRRFLVVPFLQTSANESLVREFATHASRIAFVLAGHVHRNDFRLLGNVPILIAPSVAPSYYNNPTFLQLDVDAGGALRDYTAFYYDFDSQTWNRAESFDRIFGVTSFSTQALGSIHARLASDDEMRARWAQMTVSGSSYPDITPRTWRVFWCAQTEFGTSFSTCAGVERRAEALTIAGTVAGISFVGFLALTVSRVGRRRRKV